MMRTLLLATIFTLTATSSFGFTKETLKPSCVLTSTQDKMISVPMLAKPVGENIFFSQSLKKLKVVVSTNVDLTSGILIFTNKAEEVVAYANGGVSKNKLNQNDVLGLSTLYEGETYSVQCYLAK